MAKDIPRATLRQLVRDYKANGLFRPNHSGVVAYPDTLLVYNSTGTAIPVGGAIKISGYPATTSFADALSKMINGELVLNGVASGSGDDSSGIATALDPIASGSIGRVQASGIVFARVHYNAPASGDTEYSQASATFELVKSGVFQIVAMSQKDSGNYMICAMNRLASGGGGGTTTNIAYLSNVTLVNTNQLKFTLTTKSVLTP